jgi:hypothetical protein
MDSLHAVIVKKPVSLEQAKKIKMPYTKANYYRETETSYRFRNIPKTKFIKDSFRSAPITEKVTLVYGKLN